MNAKVYVPLLVNVIIGLVLLVAGIMSRDDNTKEIGVGVLLAAAAHGGVGYATPNKES